jgi:hypothetical protein
MRAGFAALLAASLIGLALDSAATADNSLHVSGTYAVTDFGTSTCAPVGQSLFLIRCDTTGFVSQYTGDLTGATVTEFTQLINCKTGKTHGKGVETFTGSVAGMGAGTLTWRDHFHATIDCLTFAVSDFVGRGKHLSGTGELAELDGKLEFDDTTYDGVLH